MTIDGNGRIIEANETFLGWLETSDAMSLPPLSELLRTGDRIFWETHLRPLLDMEGEIREIAIELKTDDGHLPVLMNALRVETGEVPLFDVALFGAVQRRSYERELLSARKAAEESEKLARQLAQTLQRSLIPPALPTIQGLELGAAYRPAGAGDEVGGDFYDMFQLSTSEWIGVVGDVCGKGVDAAALTALVRYTLRGAAMETADLNQVVADVNSALFRDRTDRTATAVLARLNIDSDGPLQVEVSLAGHPLGRLISSTGTVSPVGIPGTLMGAYEKTAVHPEMVRLDTGDKLVLFTDGVTEARSEAEFFGDDMLDVTLGRIAGLSAQELAQRLADEAVAFQDGNARDDVAILVIARIEPGEGAG